MGVNYRESLLKDINAYIEAIERLREASFAYKPLTPVSYMDFDDLTDEDLASLKIGLWATLENASEWILSRSRRARGQDRTS